MLILPGPLPVAPPPDQATAARQVHAPVTTVAAPSSSAKARTETNTDSGSSSGGQFMAGHAKRPDLDKLVGPTPSFEANLLEVEQEKLRARSTSVEPRQPAETLDEAPKETAPEPKLKQAPPYSETPEPEHHAVDISV